MKDNAWGTFFIVLGIVIIGTRGMSRADNYFKGAPDTILTVALIIGAVILAGVAVAAPTSVKAATAAWVTLP